MYSKHNDYMLNQFSLPILPYVAIVLSVLLRYTDSDYPFGIFKLFFLSITVYCRGTGLLEVFFLIWLNDMHYHVRIAPLALHWNFDMTVVMFRGAESIYLEK